MAANYVTAGSRQTVQVLSQTESADVQAVNIYTQPSNIFTVVLVPLVTWQNGDASKAITPVAGLIEALIAGGLITGMVYVQSTDASDLLAGFMQATVSYTSSTQPLIPFTAKVLIPMTALTSLDAFNTYSTSANGDDPILVAYNQLVATANL